MAVPLSLLKDPGHLLSFGFGSGLAPFAPGTFGTLVAVPIYLLLVYYTEFTLYMTVTLAAFVFGVYLCARTSRVLGVKDHAAIVWDEIVGYLITMAFVPLHWLSVILGFMLFRLFDISKPWPISVIDSRIQGGLGVMLDDVLAGIYAAIVLSILHRYVL